MTLSEVEKLVSSLIDRHRQLEQRRVDLVLARNFLIADIAVDNNAALTSNAVAYATTVTKLEGVSTELATASRVLRDLQEAERREAAKQAETRRAADFARRDDLIDEAQDLADQLDTLLESASDVSRKLDDLMNEAGRLGDNGDIHMWARRSKQSALRALSCTSWRLERPIPGTPNFFGLVAVVSGRKRSAA